MPKPRPRRPFPCTGHQGCGGAGPRPPACAAVLLREPEGYRALLRKDMHDIAAGGVLGHGPAGLLRGAALPQASSGHIKQVDLVWAAIGVVHHEAVRRWVIVQRQVHGIQFIHARRGAAGRRTAIVEHHAIGAAYMDGIAGPPVGDRGGGGGIDDIVRAEHAQVHRPLVVDGVVVAGDGVEKGIGFDPEVIVGSGEGLLESLVAQPEVRIVLGVYGCCCARDDDGVRGYRACALGGDGPRGQQEDERGKFSVHGRLFCFGNDSQNSMAPRCRPSYRPKDKASS